jgi:hypothetical protein
MWFNNSPEPTPITLAVPRSRLTVWAARLSFCREATLRVCIYMRHTQIDTHNNK